MLDDLISRQAAIDLWDKYHYTIAVDAMRYDAELRQLPSAQPKKGGWNFIGDDMFECSMCGVSYTAQQLNSLRNYDTDPYLPWFCPHCGSDMRGE